MTKANKPLKPKYRCQIEIVTPFYSYESDKKDAKALRHIEKWIKDSIENNLEEWCSFIPLYIEKEGTSYIEDITRKSEIKIKWLKS